MRRAALLALLAALAPPAAAQIGHGGFSGTVHLVGSTGPTEVTLQFFDVVTGEQLFGVAADSDGAYHPFLLSGGRPGPYFVRFSAPGFRCVQGRVELPPGPRHTRINVDLPRSRARAGEEEPCIDRTF